MKLIPKHTCIFILYDFRVRFQILTKINTLHKNLQLVFFKTFFWPFFFTSLSYPYIDMVPLSSIIIAPTDKEPESQKPLFFACRVSCVGYITRDFMHLVIYAHSITIIYYACV